MGDIEMKEILTDLEKIKIQEWEEGFKEGYKRGFNGALLHLRNHFTNLCNTLLKDN